MFLLAIPLALAVQTVPLEEPVAPYRQGNVNAGATPFSGDGMWRAFHGGGGVDRIVERFIAINQADPRIGDIFKGQDLIRLRRVLNEHFCHILGGGCDYSGRTMKDAHRNMGIQSADMSALVENLQQAMRSEGVSFAAQNRFLAKLAPMKREVVER